MPNGNILELVCGVPSAQTYGFTGITDTEPRRIDLLAGDFAVEDANGQPNWNPAVASLKNNGVRADSNLQDGTTLLGAAYDVVSEKIVLIGGANMTPQMRNQALSDLLDFSRLTHEFHTTNWQTAPVYIKYQSPEMIAPQYALLYTLDIDTTRLHPFDSNDAPQIAIVAEREPAWRWTVAPGGNPKVYTAEKQGVAVNLSLETGNLVERKVASGNSPVMNYDEPSTTNINYITIPAALIPGDAPASAMISLKLGTLTGGLPRRIYFARSTRRDLFPNNNTVNANQRRRVTLQVPDMFQYTPVGMTVTEVQRADGVYANGQSVNRFVTQATYPTTVVQDANGKPQNIGIWQRTINQYPGRYAVFLRATFTTSTTAGDFLFSFGVTQTPNALDTPEVSLSNGGAFGVTYLGTIDFVANAKRVSPTGGGLDSLTTMYLCLRTRKSTASAGTIALWDVILLPVDEQAICVQNLNALTYVASQDPNPTIFLDGTGYFGYGKELLSAQMRTNSNLDLLPISGQLIDLAPGVDNVVYTVIDTINPEPHIGHEMRIDIVPRSFGKRDA